MKNMLQVSGTNPETAHLSYKMDGLVIAYHADKKLLTGNSDTKMAIYRACVEFVEKYIATPMP